MKSIYLIGSMRNERVPQVAKLLREQGFDVFDDWYSPGAQADEKWQEYEKDRGRSYAEALNGYHAKHVFELDHTHLKRCDAVVLVMPAGKSAHVELGWAVGQGKPGFVLFDEEPERYDIMYRFVYETKGAVCFSERELLERLGPHASTCTDRVAGDDCRAYANTQAAYDDGTLWETYCPSCRVRYPEDKARWSK